jgi:hypothetical protein
MTKREFIRALIDMRQKVGYKPTTNAILTLKRRQAIKQHEMLSRYREEPVGPTSQQVLQGAMRLSEVIREIKNRGYNPLIPRKKNWFKRFFDRVRILLSDPNSPIMVDFRLRLQYNLLIDDREE